MDEDLCVTCEHRGSCILLYIFMNSMYFFMMVYITSTLFMHFVLSGKDMSHLLHVIMIISANYNIAFVLCIIPFNYRMQYVTVLNLWLLRMLEKQ